MYCFVFLGGLDLFYIKVVKSYLLKSLKMLVIVGAQREMDHLPPNMGVLPYQIPRGHIVSHTRSVPLTLGPLRSPASVRMAATGPTAKTLIVLISLTS